MALRTTAAVLAGVATLTGVGVSIAYLERRAIGLRLATDYLRARGVPASLRIDRLDTGGFAGALLLGPPGDPDLSVERAEVQFAPLQFGLGGLAAPRVRAVRLFRPVLKAHLDAHGLRFGSLQRLIDESARGKGGGPLPDVAIEAGRLRLETPGGVVEVGGDGLLRNGRLVRLSARLPSTALTWGATTAREVQGELSLVTRADRLHATWRLAASELRTHAATAHGLESRGAAEVPYPTGAVRLGGRLVVDATLRMRDVAANGGIARNATSVLHASGEFTSAPRALAFDGDASASASAASAQVATASLVGPSLALQVRRTRLAYGPGERAGDALTIDALVEIRLAAADLGDPALPPGLQIGAGATAAHGGLRISPAGLGIDLAGDAEMSAGLTPAGVQRVVASLPAVAGADLRRAVAANLRSVRVRAPAYRLTVAGPRTALRLDAPVRADFAAGGAIEISPRPAAPVLTRVGGAGNGAFDARVTGAGLPGVALQVGRWSSDGVRVEVESTLAIDGDAGPLRGGFLHAHARITRIGSRLTVIAPECADLGFAAIDVVGAPSVRGAQARLCPTDAPLFDLGAHGWSTTARITALQALAPGAGLAFGGGEGGFALHDGAPVRGAIELTRLRITDTRRPTRLRPLVVSGAATLAPRSWTGALRLGLSGAPAPVGRLTFAYDPAAKAGRAGFASTGLRFVPDGLQPSSFAPAAAQWASALDGPLELAANVAWAGGRITSAGEVRTGGLDLQTPAGRVHGLAGDVVFGSLYPLATASTQRLRAKALDTALPLTDLGAAFDLDAQRLTLRHTEATLAGGRIALDPLRVPLAASADLASVVHVDHVDVGAIMANLGLADSVALQAKVSGALPFSLRSGALAIAGGRLTADGPGRLTIRREALGGAVTTGGAAGAQTNAVQDFAYQALENLAFDALDAEVASLPAGRLGVVLHVHGRHDPPKAVPTRVRLVDLVAGHAFDRPLPLPKGTGVELTLDTSLNFDELLGDYATLRTTAGAAASSAPVQPRGPK